MGCHHGFHIFAWCRLQDERFAICKSMLDSTYPAALDSGLGPVVHPGSLFGGADTRKDAAAFPELSKTALERSPPRVS